ncbi:hypothetical protein Q0M94_25030 (plasmid) [Deinococcus radiomollis]|uniref:hypothetical protein n=1 Tax=Deinococcus radiomollis TaxID=468916 RepID=UPI003892947C
MTNRNRCLLALTLAVSSLLGGALAQSQGAGTISTYTSPLAIKAISAPSGWVYGFLQAPFLIGRNWAFTTTGGTVLAPTPADLVVKLGGETPSASDGIYGLYAFLGAHGWELVQCGDSGWAVGFSAPGCSFKRPL